MSIYSGIIMTNMFNPREALFCARLNLRRAKHRLQAGSLRYGISALYDSVLFGMIYYALQHKGFSEADLGDAGMLFHSLTGTGIFEDPNAFNRLSLRVERALWQEPNSLDANLILMDVEKMLAKLYILPWKNPDSSGNQKITRTGKDGDAYLQTTEM